MHELERLLHGELERRQQPLPVDYMTEHRELNQAYVARTRVRNAVETAKDVADGLHGLDEYISAKGATASPAVMAQMRGIQQIIAYGCGALINDYLHGRSL